jgi:hypothetical protein
MYTFSCENMYKLYAVSRENVYNLTILEVGYELSGS